ncbi:MAG: hypothetical protein JO257_04855 [Deltaproteobacteria bacterium]|nr:hypothetical protein [Deltaproteobacteria bacterium]
MMRLLAATTLALVACTDSTTSVEQAAKVPHADVHLDAHHTDIAQSADTTWTLAKTGSVDTAAKTVTWTITATPSSTVQNHLILSGQLKVKNTGNAPATIGNIVVALQTKQGVTWQTRAADVADATSGDGATVAHTANGDISEGAASGTLGFTDAHNNSVFSLVPEVVIAPGQKITLNFHATFDNNVLGLAPHVKVRSYVAVSFGNNGTGAHNIDINGNGVIDADEASVATLESRDEDRIPCATTGNTTATLTDTASDITTTGTVTFSGAAINISGTSGTARVSYDGGAHGGEITNCAHLVTSAGQHVDACNTQTIGANVCTPGAPGCGWKDGDVVTYTQFDYGDPANPAATLLEAQFAAIYTELDVGLPGHEIQLSDAISVIQYMPDTGAFIEPLQGVYLDPQTTEAGDFGADVVALRIDVDFADKGVTGATSSTRFGDLLYCDTTSPLNGQSVRAILATANTLLGNGAVSVTFDQIAPVVANLTAAFDAGSVSVFAQQHVFAGSCP